VTAHCTFEDRIKFVSPFGPPATGQGLTAVFVSHGGRRTRRRTRRREFNQGISEKYSFGVGAVPKPGTRDVLRPEKCRKRVVKYDVRPLLVAGGRSVEPHACNPTTQSLQGERAGLPSSDL